MKELTEDRVRKLVERAIENLRPNDLGFRLSKDGVHQVDGRWWAVVELKSEPGNRSEVWAILDQLAQFIEEDDPRGAELISLTAA